MTNSRIKFFIDQHGCAKNQTDAELIAGFLVKKGLEHTLNPDEADYILINSCGFINSAKKESIDAVYRASKNYPDAKIILTGCLAERYSDELFESIPELKGVFGNGNLSGIADFIEACEKKRSKKIYEQKGICEGERPVLYGFKGSAYVKITEGCSNHCSFCAIPLIRGELRSRKAINIVQEIKTLVENGVYEINLIGQDIAAYGTGLEDENLFKETALENNKYNRKLENCSSGTSALSLLLKLIGQIKGDYIIRLLYIHPDHFNFDIIDAIRKDKRIVHYFDIPFQSGDDEIIRAMNRKGTKKSYEAFISELQKEIPDMVLRTTFLTGFPGETENAFNNSKDFLQNIKPHWSGTFPYSREEDTPAYSLKNKVSSKIAVQRSRILEEEQMKITSDKLKGYEGQTLRVLVEEVFQSEKDNSEDFEGLAIGRAWFQAPDVDGAVVIRFDAEDEQHIREGNVVTVKIISCTGVDLDSRFVYHRN